MRLLSAFSHRTVKSTCEVTKRPVSNEGFPNFLASYCTSSSKSKDGGIELPPEPQDCCMSGCANCVWIAYAEQLSKILNDGGDKAKQKIIEHVKDPNLRAFLMLELQHLFKKGK